VSCEAPICWLAYNALGTAGAGITVSDGYTFTSLSGYRCISMLGEVNGGGPVGGEIPEPSTIVLSAAGLVALGLARLRRHLQRR
jgi:hypothetical protein